MTPLNHDRAQFLATVADLYYNEGFSQAQIARRFGYSRSAISRLLTEARENGIVQITVNHPLHRHTELEHRLRDTFRLSAVRVASRGNLDYERILRVVGKLGAITLQDFLPSQSVLGISWGTAAHEVAQALQPSYLPDVQVVQMIGSLGTEDPQIDGPEVVRTIANVLGASYHTLNAPLVTANATVRDTFMQERGIRETLQLAAQSDVALVGIGSVELERSSLVRAGYLSPSEMQQIKQSGAVGDVCAVHYDQNGTLLDIDINHRIVGVNPHQLTNTSCKRIGVAAGKTKAPSILGALRGRLIDILVTDSSAAETVLALHLNQRSARTNQSFAVGR